MTEAKEKSSGISKASHGVFDLHDMNFSVHALEYFVGNEGRKSKVLVRLSESFKVKSQK